MNMGKRTYTREEADRILALVVTPIKELGLSTRPQACLKNDNIEFLGELLTRTGAELRRIPNFGRMSLNEVNEVLATREIELGQFRDINLNSGATTDDIRTAYQTYFSGRIAQPRAGAVASDKSTETAREQALKRVTISDHQGEAGGPLLVTIQVPVVMPLRGALTDAFINAAVAARQEELGHQAASEFYAVVKNGQQDPHVFSQIGYHAVPADAMPFTVECLLPRQYRGFDPDCLRAVFAGVGVYNCLRSGIWSAVQDAYNQHFIPEDGVASPAPIK
jgi:hypothetical protein